MKSMVQLFINNIKPNLKFSFTNQYILIQGGIMVVENLYITDQKKTHIKVFLSIIKYIGF